VLAFRIGTVKNSKNFLRADGLARVMMVGVAKESMETTASSESDLGRRDYTNESPFGQS
jgi:hypothetical protein